MLYVASATDGFVYKSTDKGSNWAPMQMPLGVMGTPRHVLHDTRRWMILMSSRHLLTSLDAGTWTARNIPLAGSELSPRGCAALDDSVTLISTGTTSLYTTNAGVTWGAAQNSIAGSGYAYGRIVPVITDGFSGFVVGGGAALTDGDNRAYQLLVSASDLSAGGAYFRKGVLAMGTVRTNAAAYIRVS